MRALGIPRALGILKRYRYRMLWILRDSKEALTGARRDPLGSKKKNWEGRAQEKGMLRDSKRLIGAWSPLGYEEGMSCNIRNPSDSLEIPKESSGFLRNPYHSLRNT